MGELPLPSLDTGLRRCDEMEVPTNLGQILGEAAYVPSGPVVTFESTLHLRRMRATCLARKSRPPMATMLR